MTFVVVAESLVDGGVKSFTEYGYPLKPITNEASLELLVQRAKKLRPPVYISDVHK